MFTLVSRAAWAILIASLLASLNACKRRALSAPALNICRVPDPECACVCFVRVVPSTKAAVLSSASCATAASLPAACLRTADEAAGIPRSEQRNERRKRDAV
jgi:hypothetical protein